MGWNRQHSHFNVRHIVYRADIKICPLLDLFAFIKYAKNIFIQKYNVKIVTSKIVIFARDVKIANICNYLLQIKNYF